MILNSVSFLQRAFQKAVGESVRKPFALLFVNKFGKNSYLAS